MHLYNKLNKNLQHKIDICINNNNKKIYKNEIKKELNNFNHLKLKWLYFKYYNDYFNKFPKLYLGFEVILNDILFWLNEPYSRQFDTPFMSGFLSKRSIKTIKKINPNINIHFPFDDNGMYLNCDILKYFMNKINLKNNKINIKKIIINILDTLLSRELEDLYIYTLYGIKKNVIDITIKFNK